MNKQRYYDVGVKRSFAPNYDAERSTLSVPALLKHSQSANPTFAGASSAKWAFDPYIILFEITRWKILLVELHSLIC